MLLWVSVVARQDWLGQSKLAEQREFQQKHKAEILRRPSFVANILLATKTKGNARALYEPNTSLAVLFGAENSSDESESFAAADFGGPEAVSDQFQ